MSGRIARRRFVGGLSAVGLLATAPGWVKSAFAGERTCLQSVRALAALGAAFRRAHASGRRLLVFVVPEADDEKYTRGQLFGAWLNHATDAGLAPLSLCELAAASMSDLRKLVPKVPAGEPLMVLVDPSALDRPGVAIDPPVSAIERYVWPSADEGADFDRLVREQDERENAAWDARIAVLSRATRVAVAPRVSFPDEAQAAASVRRRWVEGKVAGTYWATASGCGTTIEGVDFQLGHACGMGHVPEKARRFLYLFSRSRDTAEDPPE